MPVESKITTAIARTIRAAKKRGEGSRRVADAVRDKHGIELDKRTIDRWVAANPAAPPKTRPAPPADPATPPAAPPAEAPKEVDTLTRLVAREIALRERLEADPEMGALSLATLNREYRQTLEAIEVAKSNKGKRTTAGNADARWMVQKLRRWVAMNAEGAKPAEPNGVPEAARTAGS